MVALARDDQRRKERARRFRSAGGRVAAKGEKGGEKRGAAASARVERTGARRRRRPRLPLSLSRIRAPGVSLHRQFFLQNGWRGARGGPDGTVGGGQRGGPDGTAKGGAGGRDASSKQWSGARKTDRPPTPGRTRSPRKGLGAPRRSRPGEQGNEEGGGGDGQRQRPAKTGVGVGGRERIGFLGGRRFCFFGSWDLQAFGDAPGYHGGS